MLKRILFIAVALCAAYTADAQVATAPLDASMNSEAAGATGWRFNSSISLWGTVAEGKNAHNGAKDTGEVKAGLPARGPDDHSSLPHMSAAYRGDAFVAEMTTFLKNGANYDATLDLNTGLVFNSYGLHSERKTQSLKLAYVFGESVSVGIGYTKESRRVRLDYLGTSFSQQLLDDRTDIQTSLATSIRLGDIFYIGAGLEKVEETGIYGKSRTDTGLDKGDLADNSWTNTMLGIALMSGDPKNFQFRMEYAQITSPESTREGNTPNQKNTHRPTTESNGSIEVRFGGFLIGYHNMLQVEDKIDGYDTRTTTTMIGLGWQPLTGLMVSLYSWSNVYTSNDDNLGEIAAKPKGYTFRLGYNF
ncbi:hypothetical protein KKI24_28795 [bacterium]|nr:hypothetical protein [bacterium]